MGVIAGANINDNGLIFSLDAANFRSYSGSGNTSFGLVGGIGGTLVNGVGFTSTNSGSFIFDGTNDYVFVGDNSLLNSFTNMTLEVVTKYTTTNDQIFAQKVNYALNHWFGIEIYSSTIAAACYQGGANYLSVPVSSYPATWQVSSYLPAPLPSPCCAPHWPVSNYPAAAPSELMPCLTKEPSPSFGR